jgi:hypothetical protein
MEACWTPMWCVHLAASRGPTPLVPPRVVIRTRVGCSCQRIVCDDVYVIARPIWAPIVCYVLPRALLQEMGLKFSSEAAGVDMGNTLYSFRKAKSGAKAKEEMKVRYIHVSALLSGSLAYPSPFPSVPVVHKYALRILCLFELSSTPSASPEHRVSLSMDVGGVVGLEYMCPSPTCNSSCKCVCL